MKPELSPKQEIVLKAIRKNGFAEYTHYMGRFGGDYWEVDGIGRCTAHVKALIKKGYLEVKQTNAFGDKRASVARRPAEG